MSLEARARLAARNRQTCVWKLAKNTGTKTPEGRAKVSQNAVKHGARSAGMQAAAEWVRSLRHLLVILKEDDPEV